MGKRKHFFKTAETDDYITVNGVKFYLTYEETVDLLSMIKGSLTEDECKGDSLKTKVWKAWQYITPSDY